MPLINTTGVVAVQHLSSEINKVMFTDIQVWKKQTAATSIFSLATPFSSKAGINVVSATDTSAQLERPSTSRGWISWAANWSPGSRIIFDWVTTPSARLLCGLDDAIGLGSLNHTIVNAIGRGSVDYIIPAGGGWNYFGFSISNGQAAGLLTITNFAVYAP